VGFQLLSIQLRNLWHWYENVIFLIFIEDKVMFSKINGLIFKPKPYETLGILAAGV
jgi:hypothetical protein